MLHVQPLPPAGHVVSVEQHTLSASFQQCLASPAAWISNLSTSMSSRFLPPPHRRSQRQLRPWGHCAHTLSPQGHLLRLPPWNRPSSARLGNR